MLTKKSSIAAVLNGLLTGYDLPGNLNLNLAGQVNVGSMNTYVLGALGGALASVTTEYLEEMKTPILQMVKSGRDLNSIVADSVVHGVGYLVWIYILNPNIFASGTWTMSRALSIGIAAELGAQAVDMYTA